jgi:hypothetical protein
VTGDWRKLHREELGEKINAYKIMVGKPEEKKQFRKPRRRWEDIIKMDFK